MSNAAGGFEDPLRTPPEARVVTGDTNASPYALSNAQSQLPSLDHKTEQLRLGAQQLLGEPVLAIILGRGMPPRKWPPLAALIVAGLGALLLPVGGAGAIVFMGTALTSALLWRQHQEGNLPHRAERPAGALAVTPTRLALVEVGRGWFELSYEARSILAAEPLQLLALERRLGWGTLRLAGRPLHVDSARRKSIVDAVNRLIRSVLDDEWHGLPFQLAAPVPPPPTGRPDI